MVKEKNYKRKEAFFIDFDKLIQKYKDLGSIELLGAIDFAKQAIFYDIMKNVDEVKKW